MMIRFNPKRMAALAALAFGLGLAGTASAQYTTTVGTAPGGGNTVVGDGPGLGELFTGDTNLSSGGFDAITFNLGSTAQAVNPVDTIYITTANNTLLNNGSIFGLDGVNPGDTGFNAIQFTTSPQTIINHGLISGGAGGANTSYGNSGGNGGNAIYFSGGNPMDSILISNTGLIFGGNGGAGGGGNNSGGDGGYAIYLGDIFLTSLTNSLIANSGTIAGGDGGVDTHYRGTGGNGGDGIYVLTGTVNGFTINNNTGSILGGAGQGDTGYRRSGGGGGYAIGIFANQDISNVAINNVGGLIAGGIGGDAGQKGSAGDGGDAISIYSDGGNLTGLGIANTVGGSILGGNGGNGTDDYAYAGDGGYAVDLYGNNSVSNVLIANGGLIQGGLGGSAQFEGNSGRGGDAIYVEAGNLDISQFTLNNSGSVIGGDGGAGLDDYTGGGSGGNGLYAYANENVANLGVNNSGLIAGGNGGDAGYQAYPGQGGVGIYVEGNSSVSDVTIMNSGTIAGGSGGNATDYYTYSGGSGGEGITIYANNNDVTNTSISNSGSILGGNGGTSGWDSTGGYGNDAIYLESNDGNIAATTIFNSGLIKGGKGGDGSSSQYSYGGSGGYGIDISADQNLTGLSITNTATGKILGGAGGNASNQAGGGNGGDAIYAGTNNGDINGFLLSNAGIVAGGNGGNGDDANDYEGGYGGYGVYLYAEEKLLNVTINNSGAILGGNGGNMVDGDSAIRLETNDDIIDGVSITNSGFIMGGSGGFSANYDGGSGYDGIRILGYGGDVRNVSINNSGFIGAGHGGGSGDSGSYSGDGGDAIEIYSNNNMSNIAIGNSGIIQAGNAGIGGYGGYGGDGVYVYASNGLTNFALNNTGMIYGGNGSGVGYSGGEAVDIYGNIQPVDHNVVINNYGGMIGGNGLNGADAGIGVKMTTTNATLNNYGVISAGSGPNPIAIKLDGGGNTINLYGHSVTNGMIQASGPTDSNHLNIRLSGISPAIAASVNAQLAAEGITPGHESSGSIVIRGLVIQWDPIVVNLQFSSYQLQGATPNQKAVGANLDSFAVNPTGDMLGLLNAIDGSASVPLSLEQLSPQPFQIYSDIAFANATFSTLSIDERLNNLRDGSESIDTMGIGGNTDKTTSAGFSKDGKSVVVPEARSLQKRWGFFAAGSGLFANIDAHGGDLSDQGFTTSGLMLGVDGKINDNFVAGLLFNYNYTVADLDNHGSKANVQTFGGGAYAGYHKDGWYSNSLLTYGHNSYDSQRNISLPGFNRNATGSTDGSQWTGNLDGGYDFHLTDKFTAGPLLGLQYVHLSVDSFRETGAGAANLAVGDQDADSLRSRIGVHAEYKTQIAKEVAFGTEIHAAWQHEFLDDSRSISGQFIGSGLSGFNVKTTKPEREAAIAGASVNITVRDTMTLFFDYDVQAGQQSYLEQSVKGGVKFSF